MPDEVKMLEAAMGGVPVCAAVRLGKSAGCGSTAVVIPVATRKVHEVSATSGVDATSRMKVALIIPLFIVVRVVKVVVPQSVSSMLEPSTPSKYGRTRWMASPSERARSEVNVYVISEARPGNGSATVKMDSCKPAAVAVLWKMATGAMASVESTLVCAAVRFA